MATPVADRSSNKNEQIVHAAEVIGRSLHRAKIFAEIYRGKSPTKTVTYLIQKTKLPHTRVLDAGKVLADDEIVGKTKVNGTTAYSKIDFFRRYRDRILKLAKNKGARDRVPTKRNPKGGGKKVRIAIDIATARKSVRAQRIAVDDIKSFESVRKVPLGLNYVKISETKFKDGVARILGEKGKFKDWGGEMRDLSSTRLIVKGKRLAAAFAFKGPGMSGRLTPGKLGKNGDQIQRLTRCPAEVFIVQYWAEIDDSVLEQLANLVRAKAYFENRPLWYGIIDGQDSARLIQAYPKKFKTS